jgi:hypothetical protein
MGGDLGWRWNGYGLFGSVELARGLDGRTIVRFVSKLAVEAVCIA